MQQATFICSNRIPMNSQQLSAIFVCRIYSTAVVTLTAIAHLSATVNSQNNEKKNDG